MKTVISGKACCSSMLTLAQRPKSAVYLSPLFGSKKEVARGEERRRKERRGRERRGEERETKEFETS